MLRRNSCLPDCPWFIGHPCALAGLILLVWIVAGSQFLALGTIPSRITIGCLLFLLALLTLFLLNREGCPRNTVLLLVLPIAVMLYLRLCLLDHQTHDYQTFLTNWVTFFRENGGFSAIHLSVGDYNVPYLYFLAAISYSSVPDLYMIKLFSILFDLLLAWSALRLSRHFCRESSPLPLICFVVFLFLPTCVLNGAYWGQCDSLYAAFILLAIDAVFGSRPKTSVALLAVAFSFKLQTVFLIPLWLVFWFAKRVKFKDLLLFPVTYFITIVPALLLGKPLLEILSIYLTQTTEYTHALTMNAPTVFTFLPHGLEVDIPLIARIAIIVAFVFLFIILGLLFWKRKQTTPKLIMSAAAVMAIGIPFLLPHMHERYFFLAGAVTLVLACIDCRFIPVAVLTEAASLSSYSTYLRLKYTLPILFNGQYYVMVFEGLLMLAALIWGFVIFIKLLKRSNAT